ncbi:MAG: hypothetical protein CFE39_03590 [Comamonadaceae bacterium PBBC2]|nr:MAG: hypothetical protein CFE39_03590 [Comamonadaceae bacterium PBBC2]
MAELSERAAPFTHAQLADALLQCVRDQDFAGVKDSQNGGQAIAHFPSIDLAVVVFPHNAPPVWANVLFSRDIPQGLVADVGPMAEEVINVTYMHDVTNAAGESVAWSPGSNWDAMDWVAVEEFDKDDRSGPLPHEQRFVSPYPASLIKLMVAVGVCLLVDTAVFAWDEPWDYQGTRKTIDQWMDSMLVASNNDATSAMVALLHAGDLIVRVGEGVGAGEINYLSVAFKGLGLHTLMLSNTQPDGGWRNADGAGVGYLNMTAWDTVRLLWLILGETAPTPPPWLPHMEPPGYMFGAPSRQRLLAYLAEQGLHDVLSSTALAGVPGWQAGLPAEMPARWVQADGSVQVEDIQFPADIRAAHAQASVQFAHKTGTTDNYASDAGYVTALKPGGRRYMIALTSNLGRRYAPHPHCATDWRIPKLGAAIDAWLQEHLE